MVEVCLRGVRPTRRRNLRIVEASVADASGPMKATWFNQACCAAAHPGHPPVAQRQARSTGLSRRGARDPRRARRRRHPHHRARPGPPGLRAPAAEPDPRMGLAGDRGRRPGDRAAAAELRARRRLPVEADAPREVHFPTPASIADAARERLALEELILHQVALAASRSQRRSRGSGSRSRGGGAGRAPARPLPFEPTADQRATFADLDADLASGRPMQRLLMGEVGSARPCAPSTRCCALEAATRPALMAPTETLAEQHAATLDRLLAGEPIPFVPVQPRRPPCAGAARRWSGSRPASSGWSSARTR